MLRGAIQSAIMMLKINILRTKERSIMNSKKMELSPTYKDMLKYFYLELDKQEEFNTDKDDNFVAQAVSERLIAIRKEYANMTIKDLSKFSDINRNTIHRYEAGEFAPSIKNLMKILDAMNFPISSFIKYPESFDAWKNEYIKTDMVNNGMDLPNVFQLLENFSKILDEELAYRKNGKLIRLPKPYREILKKSFESCSAFLELLEYDSDQSSNVDISIILSKTEKIEYH